MKLTLRKALLMREGLLASGSGSCRPCCRAVTASSTPSSLIFQFIHKPEAFHAMPSFAAILLAALICFLAAAWPSQTGALERRSRSARGQSPLPAVAPRPPTVGLALEGGGALGLAHVGVLQRFEEHRVPVDRISGTSMGAPIRRTWYATGQSPVCPALPGVEQCHLRTYSPSKPPTARPAFDGVEDRREIPRLLTIGLKSRLRVPQCAARR